MRRKVIIPSGRSIDAYLRRLRHNTDFILQSGDYWSCGGAAFAEYDFCMVAPGCSLTGAVDSIGGPVSTIHFSDGGYSTVGTQQFECLTAGSRSGRSDRVSVESVVLQCPTSPQTRELGLVGLHVWSDSGIVRNVTIDGVCGTRRIGGGQREGFGLLVNASGAPDVVGGFDVDRVRVTARDPVDSGTKDDENYVTGLFVGLKRLSGAPDTRNRVSCCTVSNAGTRPAHAAFAFYDDVDASGITNRGHFSRSIFCDTGGGRGVHIRGAYLNAAAVAVDLSGGLGDYWYDFVMERSRITLTPGARNPYAAVLVLKDYSPTKKGCAFAGVIVKDTEVTLAGFEKKSYFTGSLDGYNAANVGVQRLAVKGGALLPPVVVNNETPATSFRIK